VSKIIGYVPVIGSVTGDAIESGADFLQHIDHELIRNKLKMISKCGDIIDQCEVARKVARQLTNRYKEQLTRLQDDTTEIDNDCCSRCKRILPRGEPLDESEPAERVALFAVNYIVSAVADQDIKMFKFRKANDKDSLVQMLVELACRAHEFTSCSLKRCCDNPNQYLLFGPKSNTNSQIQPQQVPITENQVRNLFHYEKFSFTSISENNLTIFHRL
jgi:hypothetical protein